ncbi:MAG: TonB-dependent receptor [Steroidobacteraceae bacterium]
MNVTDAIRRSLHGNRGAGLLMMAGALLPLVGQPAFAAAPQDEELEEAVVAGDRLRVMQNEPVDSVFGFGKRVDETPRALTTISAELLEKTIITEIDDLVALTPGSFTQSFFGVAGSLDVRGSPGETYFRGVKRVENLGNYPTPIGASDRIDVVRGPASPMYGPSKIGGYLNFVPKSARAGNGRYLGETTGAIGATFGSYGKRVINAEVGGPVEALGKEGGFYLYGESENSDSYYENSGVQQTILQASFDFQLTDTWRTEFGGMYQYFNGGQVAGWNRLTQALIDDGTYISGSPASLDANGNGLLGESEALAAGLNPTLNFGGAPSPAMALLNPGITHIKGSQVLVQEDDVLQDDVVTLYFDMIGEFESGLKVQNKLFFESLENINENAYGFSQYVDTYAFEDQLNFTYGTEFGSTKANFQFGPSIRYQGFDHGDNFAYEYFDRRDLSLGPLGGSPVDRREMSTRGQEATWSTNTWGRYIDYGAAFLADLTFFERLNLLAGGRYDKLDITSVAAANSNSFDYLGVSGTRQTDKDDGFSWSASLSYDLGGIHPYVTIARQSTLVTGQGGQVPTNLVANGNALGKSKLDEYGIKGTVLEGKLFFAVDYYEQERTDYSAQDTVTNNSTLAKGYEGELRWVVNPVLTVTGAYSNQKIYNLGANSDFQFSFMGAEDLVKLGIDPSSVFGGTLGWFIETPDHRKAGIPENIYSLNFLVGFEQWVPGLSGSVSATHVDSVYSGYSKVVKLPSYTLLNAGVRYEKGSWAIGLQSKNVTNERYFRSNFPDLFGASVVLPEVPRTFLVTADYKF